MRALLPILVFVTTASHSQAARYRTFPTEHVNAQHLTLGSDGNIWFTSFFGEVGRITPNGIVTIFPSGPASSTGMVAGPDGALWISHIGGGLARMSTSGSFESRFHVDGALPSDIAVGGDGCLWATEPSRGEIWRLCLGSEAPQLVRFTVGGSPQGLTRGGDGNIWFTDPVGNSVRRITPLGGVTSHQAGLSPNARPTAIATDENGDLRFIEHGKPVLGRLRIRTGEISELSLEGYGFPRDSHPVDLAQGPGGFVYFAVGADSPACDEVQEKRLAFVVDDLVVKVEPPPPGTAPGHLTKGLAGSLWMADVCRKRVHRYAATGPEPLDYYPLTPCRAVDTRGGPEGPLGAFGHRLFVLSGACDIPLDAKALAANVTVTGSEAGGDLKIFAANVEPNDTTVLSFRAGRTRANAAQIGLSPDGGIIVHNASPASAHVVLDVSGYWR